MRFISMCSGIEAASVAWHMDSKWGQSLGFEPLVYSELEPFPSAVLAHRFPNMPNVGDLTVHDWKQYRGKCDLVVAGTPCQAFSVAGLRKSLEDRRGNVTLAFVEAVHDIRPTWVVWENVPGVLNTTDNAFGCFLAGLTGADAPLVSALEGGAWPGAGVVSGPEFSAAWRVCDAQFWGVPQRRRRVFLVGHFGDWKPASEVLFESGCCRWDYPEGEDEGQGATGAAHEGTPGCGGLGPEAANGRGDSEGGSGTGGGVKFYRWQNDTDGIVEDDISATMKAMGTGTDERSVPAYVLAPPDPARAKACNMDGSSPDSDITGCLVGHHPGGTTDLTPVVYGPVKPIPILEAGARTGKSTDDPRAGIGVGKPGDPMFTLQAGKQHAVGAVIAFDANSQDQVPSDKVSPTLRAGGAGPHPNAGCPPAICFQQNSRSEVRDMGPKTGAVTSEPGAQCQNYIFDPYNSVADSEVATSLGTNCGQVGRTIAFTQNQAGDVLTGDKAPAMGTNANATGRNTPKVQTGMAVRRLTPIECSRLQGFFDGWTKIPWRGKEAEICPDGPQYKAYGNSFAVPVVRWIGERLKMVEGEAGK